MAKMQIEDGTSSVGLDPLDTPQYQRPDARRRGYRQYDSGVRQYWDTGASERHTISVNDIAQTEADLINTWWRNLTILTVTPDTGAPGTTYYARVNPGGQRPFQMMFATGYQSKYAATLTLNECSSSSSSSGA